MLRGNRDLASVHVPAPAWAAAAAACGLAPVPALDAVPLGAPSALVGFEVGPLAQSDQPYGRVETHNHLLTSRVSVLSCCGVLRANMALIIASRRETGWL